MRTVYKIANCDMCLDELSREIPPHTRSALAMFGDRWYDFATEDKLRILALIGLRCQSDLCVSLEGRWLCKQHVQKIVDGFDLWTS